MLGHHTATCGVSISPVCIEPDIPPKHFNEALSSKYGMTISYVTLGAVYEQQGHKEQVKQTYQKSINFFKTIGNSTIVKQVQDTLDDLFMMAIGGE
jgi:hypothetical protein